MTQVAYALDPRDPSAAAASAVAKLPQAWHPVALASQLRSLYQISNGGATARKTERDEYVDAIRCSAALEKGVHRFRLRLDQIAGEDHCNHVGFVAGDAYSGSALNSVDSCGLEVDSGRILMDGRACTQISRRPAQGDVIVLQIDVDSGNFSCGVEGEALVSSYWACEKRPVFLALSFRRVGWQVTILSSPQSADHDTMSRKEQAAHDLALIHSSLGVLSPSITLLDAQGYTLAFWLFMDTELGTTYDQLFLYADTGLQSIPLWDKTQLVEVAVWSEAQVNISALAGQTFSLRFAFDTVDSAVNTGQGVMIDDLRVTSSCSLLPCLDDASCDDGLTESVELCTASGCVYTLL